MGDRIKLNLGAGTHPIDGYINMDRKTGQEVYPLDVCDGTVDEIRASHILEHFPHVETGNVVLDWANKLAPGGVLKIAVPDFEFVSREYLSGKPINVQGYVSGGQTDDDDYHKTIFDSESLTELMASCGLRDIHKWESEINDCARICPSVCLMGTKPHPNAFKPSDIVGVLAEPRFGPTIHHHCIQEAMHKLGILVNSYQTCYWEQSLSEEMEKAIEIPSTKYVLTFDYDSIFQPSDVYELYALMETYQDVDSVCPVQMRRGTTGAALFSIDAGDGNSKTRAYSADFDRNLTPIKSGHFGLTMIRADKLRAFRRPWMLGSPNEEGRWRGQKHDPDIAFWYGWKDAGNTVCLANNVRIGHIEMMIMWPGENFKLQYQNVSDYVENGKPTEVHR